MDSQEVQHTSIDRKALIDFMKSSNIVVDYTNPNHSGLTMRSIECLGAKKLATNNKKILEETFFYPDNIWIYDEKKFFGLMQV